MSDWVNVFAGDPGEVEVLAGRLEAEGYTTFVPDRTTKVVDPFSTGSQPLLWQLQVPRAYAPGAQRRLHEIGAVGEHARLEDEDDEAERVVENLRLAGKRLQWTCIAAILFFPMLLLVPVFAILYHRAVARAGVRPPNHGTTTTVLYTVYVLVAVVLLAILVAPRFR